jgi:hypothetical protein
MPCPSCQPLTTALREIRDERDQLAAQVENLTAQVEHYRNELARCGDGRLVPRGPQAPPQRSDPRFRPPPIQDPPETTKVTSVVLVSQDERTGVVTPKARRTTKGRKSPRTSRLAEHLETALRNCPDGLQGSELRKLLQVSKNHLNQLIHRLQGHIASSQDHDATGRVCRRYRWVA